jgi:DNA-directed RNA polymerase sigma subunit (sigma70/sigma32)
VSFPGDEDDEIVQKVLGQLPESHAAIIRFRFGLDGGPLHTLAETGVQFGVSRDAVRRIETATLAKLNIAKGPEPPGLTENGA